MTIIWEDRWVKKLGKILLFFCLFSSLLCGCQKEDVADGEFVATMESSGGDTKSYISQKHNCWESTDIVWVNGAPSKEFQLDAELGKAHFKPAERAESYSMFTYGDKGFTWSGNTVTFSLPENYADQDMPMYASTADFGPVMFRNLFSVIHFTNVPSGKTITVSAQKSNLSGTFTCNMTNGTFTAGTGSKQRVVTAPSSGEVWMVVPSIPNSETLTIRIGTLRSTDSDLQFKTRAIPANMILNCPAFSNHDYTLVHNADELEDALTDIRVTKIRLANDINFTGNGPFDDAILYTRNFEVDGNGYAITIDRPIFRVLHSKVEVTNLTLVGQFGVSSILYRYAFANSYDLITILGTSGSVTAVNCVSMVRSYGGGEVPFTAPQ